MTISFDLDTSGDEARLCEALGCKKAALPQVLSQLGKASLREYVAMIAGSGMPSKAADLQELRLLLMMEELFGGLVPADQVISRLLHVTPSRSVSLVNNIFAKYSFETRRFSLLALQNLVRDAEARNKKFYLKTATLPLVSFANRLLQTDSLNNPPIEKEPATSGSYEVHLVSMKALCSILGVKRDDLG